jgi:hypothetical protein
MMSRILLHVHLPKEEEIKRIQLIRTTKVVLMKALRALVMLYLLSADDAKKRRVYI